MEIPTEVYLQVVGTDLGAFYAKVRERGLEGVLFEDGALMLPINSAIMYGATVEQLKSFLGIAAEQEAALEVVAENAGVPRNKPLAVSPAAFLEGVEGSRVELSDPSCFLIIAVAQNNSFLASLAEIFRSVSDEDGARGSLSLFPPSSKHGLNCNLALAEALRQFSGELGKVIKS